MNYLEKVKDLYQLINTGKLMDGFEKYYAENVVMQEQGEAERVGKDVNRAYELNFLSSIKEVHGAGVNNFASNEETNVTMVESWMDLTFADGNRVKFEQVAVQQWENDHIVKELFYHK